MLEKSRSPITVEETRAGLQFMATHLAYGDPKNYESENDVTIYHAFIQNLTKDYCENVFKKIVVESNVMPTPSEFGKFFGVTQRSSTLPVEIRAELLQAAHGDNIRLSQISNAVLKYLGTDVYSIRNNTKERDKITRKAIEETIEIFKARPELKEQLLYNPDKELVKRIPSPEKKGRPVLDKHRKIPTTRNLVKELASIVSVK